MVTLLSLVEPQFVVEPALQRCHQANRAIGIRTGAPSAQHSREFVDAFDGSIAAIRVINGQRQRQRGQPEPAGAAAPGRLTREVGHDRGCLVEPRHHAA